MKTSLLLKVAVLSVLLSHTPFSFPQNQKQQNAESAREFVKSLYTLYGPNGSPPNLSGENADRFFDPSLIKLAKDTRATAGTRYSGALDYDHLCNCKDTNVTFLNLRVVAKSTTSNQAVATVIFTGKDGNQNRILINLTQESGQWRISDIKDYTGQSPYTSLRGLLKREIKAWPKAQPAH